MKTLLTLLSIFIISSVYGQKSDSTHTHYRILRGGLIEHSTELKSKKYVKNGLSEITSNKKIIASGIYKDDVRFGRWRFFRIPDTLDQIYNYTTKKIEYNAVNSLLSYDIDSSKEGDKLIYAMKIGGSSYGMLFLIKNFRPPFELSKQKGIYKLYLILSIDEVGQLIKYQANIVSADYNKNFDVSLKGLKPEDLEFTPAFLNGKQVASRIIVESKITVQ
ncbi:hypothetical protein ACFOG5_23275 [Pedobacter fastidiosus]|uniref:Uncharacterized protein n=1 Tax=Pedobacter fastidiosus TaxID=2765361 RepID=A0ABR7KTX8_9SPHI|nr:hypothetical protein [Pedobacter fastidiosus]MBC6111516.1 hypothetical protein [Pedobacter fastidiosus]